MLLGLSFLCLHLSAQSDTLRIKQHFTHILQTEQPRNYRHPEVLDEVAAYISTQLQPYSDTVYDQPYEVSGKTYRNVVAVIGPEKPQTIVIGAHYDVCGHQDGADDNASGVVGLLELARLLQGVDLPYRLELVAYTLEEPPFFRSQQMGSYIHAQSVKERGLDVYGMLCLEMIGYFDASKGSQEYPLGFFSWFYGNRGDYITLVSKFGSGKFAKQYSRAFKKEAQIKAKKFKGPARLPGIDFSDHLNYWRLGWSALMITDTAFYRNKNYHEKTDTLETLDLTAMAKVIDATLAALKRLK